MSNEKFVTPEVLNTYGQKIKNYIDSKSGGLPTMSIESSTTLSDLYSAFPDKKVYVYSVASNGQITAEAMITLSKNQSTNKYYLIGWFRTVSNFYSVYSADADITLKIMQACSIANYGKQLTITNGSSIANGDILLVDRPNATSGNDVIRKSLSFDTSQTNMFLCQDGTWKEAGGSGGFEGKDYSLVYVDCYKDSSDTVRFEVQPQNCLVKINPGKLSELILQLQRFNFIDRSTKDSFWYEIGTAEIEVKNNYGVLEIVELHSGASLYIWDYDNGLSPVSQIDKIAINLDTDTYFIANYSGCHPIEMMGEYAKICLNIFDVYIRKNISFGIINDGSLDVQNSYQRILLPKKYITTELYKFSDSFGGHTFTIRIALHNLGAEDIGKKIYLYRLRTNRSVCGNNATARIKWRHPIDCDRSYTLLKKDEADSFGFGSFNNDNDHGPHINRPFFMDNEYIKTEWTITQKDLIRGYVDIEANKNWRNLLKYSDDPTENIWIVGCRTGRRCTTLSFKFGFVDVDETVVYMADEIVKIGSKFDSTSNAVTYDNWYTINKCENILSDFFYISIN